MSAMPIYLTDEEIFTLLVELKLRTQYYDEWIAKLAKAGDPDPFFQEHRTTLLALIETIEDRKRINRRLGQGAPAPAKDYDDIGDDVGRMAVDD